MNGDAGEEALPFEEADTPAPVFPGQAENGSFEKALLDWLALPSGRVQRRFLAAHPELLQPRSFALLDGWLRAVSEQEEAQRLRDARSLLQEVLARGGTIEAIREAYVNVSGGFVLDLPAWLEEVESRLSVLRSQGQPHETAPARVQLLREALDRASGASDVAPETLATLQYELALAWQEHPPTDLSQAHETAIALCDSAARSLSQDRYPRQHAQILNALGRAYTTRVAGERRDNLERAISFHRQALQVFNLPAFPQAYARTQTLLGQVYWQRVAGERRDNVEQALLCCREALRVYSADMFPQDYARTMHTLGAIYAQRIEGEVRENIEQARACFHEALRVYTAEAFAYDYARAQNNLGAVYMARIAGRRRDNVEQAITCYHEALRIWTRHAFPSQYAKLQNNLGEAYLHRLAGERSEQLEQAIASFSEALHVTSHASFPQDVAMMQQNLGDAYRQRVVGVRRENLHQALACYDEALGFYTLDAFPSEYRQMQLLRAETCALLADWAAASDAYRKALATEELLMALGAGVEGRAAILKEGRDAAVHSGFALVQLGEIETAAVTIERGRARWLAEAIELNAADPARIGDEERRTRYIAARRAFITSAQALNAPLPADQDEDARRRMHLQRTAAYRQARTAFDAIVADIRAHKDPADFLNAPLDPSTLLQVSERCGAGHALVYLAATPWGGLALAVFSAHPELGTSSRFAALLLPELTGEVVSDLIESHVQDAGEVTGGFDCAQRGNALDMLARWHGVSLLEQAETLHMACMEAKQSGSLDMAAQAVISLPELAHLSAQSLDSLSERQRTLLAGTLGHLVLQQELARCLPVLAEVALNRVVAWLREEGVRSLTLIPCGALAAFPLLAAPLAGGRTVDEVLPASIAPSARSILRSEQPSGLRVGIYALGNPHPTHQVLRWGEAEALTLAALGKQAGREGAVQVQWEATRGWLLGALRQGYVVDASCHGVFEARDFLRSRLVLAMGEELTLADLLSSQADLRGLRLLMLSACQTALLDLAGARDEVYSLAAGMLQAGAEGVLASLWSVDDKATYLLMVRFAQEWFPQMQWEPPAAALARARRWLRTVTNRELRAWQATLPPLPANVDGTTLDESDTTIPSVENLLEVRGRGNRYDVLQAQELVQLKAGEQDQEALPYAAPYYWAGFQVTGW